MLMYADCESWLINTGGEPLPPPANNSILYRCDRFYVRATNDSIERLAGLLPRSLDYNAFYRIVDGVQLPYNVTLPDIRNTTLPDESWWREFFYNTSLPTRYRLPYWPFAFNVSILNWPYPANWILPTYPLPGLDYYNPAWAQYRFNNITLPPNVSLPNIPGLPSIPGLPFNVSQPPPFNVPNIPDTINLPDISLPDGFPTIPIPEIPIPDVSVPDVPDRSLFPYLNNGEVRWDQLPIGPFFSLKEGEDCYW